MVKEVSLRCNKASAWRQRRVTASWKWRGWEGKAPGRENSLGVRPEAGLDPCSAEELQGHHEGLIEQWRQWQIPRASEVRLKILDIIHRAIRNHWGIYIRGSWWRIYGACLYILCIFWWVYKNNNFKKRIGIMIYTFQISLWVLCGEWIRAGRDQVWGCCSHPGQEKAWQPWRWNESCYTLEAGWGNW